MEIKINIDALDNKITKLKNLRDRCNDIVATEKNMEGSGASIDLINQIDKEYTAIKTTFQSLLNNSISFFENIKTSTTQADAKAAKNLK